MDLNLVNKKKSIYENMHKGALVIAGKVDSFNTMTIGWGVTGVLWGKDVFIVYVRPSRYTYEFMENNEYFTVSFYDDEYKKAMGYLGTKSGRDTDKVKDVNFTPIKCGESVTFKESNLTILCRKIYIQDLDQKAFTEDVNQRYYPTDDVHRYYIGEIIDIVE
jgi:flavin reductase (DIM6/NTAB) family NADH-FMN oxidoreductase RutF